MLVNEMDYSDRSTDERHILELFGDADDDMHLDDQTRGQLEAAMKQAWGGDSDNEEASAYVDRASVSGKSRLGDTPQEIERALELTLSTLAGSYRRTNSLKDDALNAAEEFRRDLMAKPILDVKQKREHALENDQPGLAAVFHVWYKARTDPTRILKPLGIDVKLLLTCMIWTNTILAGSRAVNFFVPGMCYAHSDWNFYCVGNIDQYHNLVSFFLTVGGVLKDGEIRGSFATGTYAVRYVKYRDHDIVLNWAIDPHTTLTAIDVVNRLNLSIQACYISGVSAVCVDPDLTKNKQSVTRLPRPGRFTCKHALQVMVDKYEDRGVKFISPSRYLQEQVGSVDLEYTSCSRWDYRKPGVPTDTMYGMTQSTDKVLEVQFDKSILGKAHGTLHHLIALHDTLHSMEWGDEPVSEPTQWFRPLARHNLSAVAHNRYVRAQTSSRGLPTHGQVISTPPTMGFVDRSKVPMGLGSGVQRTCYYLPRDDNDGDSSDDTDVCGFE